MKSFNYLVVLLLVSILISGFCFSQDPGGIFPLWKSLAEGKDLPDPFGFGLNFYTQNQTFDFSELTFTLKGLSIGDVNPQDLDINNQVTEKNFKVDLWVLPFVNVFGLLGEINGRTNVDYELLDAIVGEKIRMNYKGVVYGSGVTMAGGYKSYFISLTAAFSNTKLDNSKSNLKAWVFTPKIGLAMNEWNIIKELNIWLGAMYQKTEEQHCGTINLNNSIDVQYDATLQQRNAWNSIAGIHLSFSSDLYLEFERGIGNRKHTLASLIYRI